MCERVIQLLYLCQITEASILPLKNITQSRITKKNCSSVYKQNCKETQDNILLLSPEMFYVRLLKIKNT